MGEYKPVRITNPNYLGVIAPRIKSFTDMASETGVTYESMFSYYAKSVQHGGDLSEFWVVFRDEEGTDVPVAFAHWVVRPLPHLGKAYVDGVHKWIASKKPLFVLLDKFIEFGKRHRCTIYECDFINEKVYEIIKQHAEDSGFSVKPSGKIHAIIRRAT